MWVLVTLFMPLMGERFITVKTVCCQMLCVFVMLHIDIIVLYLIYQSCGWNDRQLIGTGFSGSVIWAAKIWVSKTMIETPVIMLI